MPQAILPLFTEDMTIVNLHIGVIKRDETVYYFQGIFPIYQHSVNDRASFKHIICQLIINGVASRAELSRALGIPGRSISRWQSQFKEHGSGYFFSKPQHQRLHSDFYGREYQ
jgi:hypothetical protein